MRAFFTGSGPFDREELISVFEVLANQSVNVGDRSGIMVVGRCDWDQKDIDDYVDLHRESRLFVYSHEMLVCLLFKRDPFFGGKKVLAAFAEGHPGLEFVSRGWRGWVTAWVHPQWVTYVPDDSWNLLGNESPLAYMGYKVGQKGLDPQSRQRILELAFLGELPVVDSHEEMQAKWGDNGSPDRLRAIANHLNRIRGQKSGRENSESFSAAIADWSRDLEWMRETFYHGHFNFSWPDAQA